MKLKRIISIIICLVVMLSTLVFAQPNEQEYLEEIFTKYTTEYVAISEESTSYKVHNSEDEVMFNCIKVNETMYVACDVLNIRTIPSINSNRWNYLLKDTKVKVIGRSLGWDIIAIGTKKYFVWNSYLTFVKPENPIEIIELEKEEIIIVETAAAPQAVAESVPAPAPAPAPQEPTPPPAPAAPARQYLGNFRVTFYSAEQNA